MTSGVRVRYAPSPTGHLHIGNARTALFNYLYARHLGGKFIIRIEDTDVKRNVEGGEESQLKYLKWLGIEWDESIDVGGAYGPYRQTERLDIYRTYWQELLDKGLAYRCYCTEEELEQEREDQTARGETPRYSGKHRDLSEEQQRAFEAEGRIASIRFRVPEDKTYTFNDIVKGTISFTTQDTGDFVIVKKDGIPTYNFAVVLDDHLMEISHVLRGEDHVSNTPRQLMIYEALGWDAPQFGHMTLIVNENHKKLSKRDESIVQFIEQYDQLGYLPEALFNFISLLGWSPEGEEEMFVKEELIAIFNAERLSKSPAVFDQNKLAYMNNHYIKHADPDRIAKLAIPHLQRTGCLPEALNADQEAWAKSLVALYQEQLNSASNIVELSEMFFRSNIELDEEAKAILAEEQVPTVLAAFLTKVEATDEFTPANMAVLIKEVQKETGFKGKQLFMPIRVALTGQTHGRDLNQTIYLLGLDRVQNRLKSQI
ncbi:glutamate--tRNA ligase [Paenibacillus macquariensis]|uniref:Glutamate--tRNA ligase n=1 Tax=Paenibacillus macquariensis TaxID=948756 RepID=A0ABY1KG52_9BACL|nr:glutamate--tRNA ligase [Paenibacillus macquariensis]MEC0094011.1 glutamate--tRNA ligase [Paenibacillus macquariensis]OAB28705.1 glutamate--tRNA ligase [Paenibacillus macquariensis subsp. macquariensis]SIR61433.1 nondiscriminating glutamyl-tRNA synthetase [Paenibacillus macquariensis]